MQRLHRIILRRFALSNAGHDAGFRGDAWDRGIYSDCNQRGQLLSVLITIRVTNFISCGDWVVTEADGHGVTKAGNDYDNHYCHLWHVKDGKIDKFTEYNDTDLIMRVLCA